MKIGAPYFNARPLVWEFVEKPSSEITLIEEVPSRLAAKVRAGELDAGLLSSVEAYRNDELEVLPRIGVTSRGPVWSIKLFHSRPLDRVRSVALDTSSYTSSALTRILLAEQYGNQPEFIGMPPDLNPMLERCDAALLIGDPGLRAFHPGVPFVDLGEEWFKWTRLPFVYAVWAAPPSVFEQGLGERLYQALDYGLDRIEAILDAEAIPRSIPKEIGREYLSRIIRYRIGPEEQEGLQYFLRLAAAHGIIKMLNDEL